MVDFENENVLQDLLSGDDNDSFFEEPRAASKIIASKPLSEKSISDIFGFKDNDQQAKSNKIADSKNLEEITLPFPSSDKKQFSDKSSIMKSIFGPPAQSTKTSLLDDILKDTKPIIEKSENKSENKEKGLLQTPDFLFQENRRPRRSSVGINLKDPLGLIATGSVETNPDMAKLKNFVDTNQNVKKDLESISSIKQTKDFDKKSVIMSDIKSLPDWLGSVPKIKDDVVKIEEENKAVTTNSVDLLNVNPSVEENETKKDVIDSFSNQQNLTMSSIQLHNTSMALHQQESQLITALQLKKYEENLNDMQRKQQYLFKKQEAQFNNIIEKQIVKQQSIENNIQIQQERINNYVKMLTSQISDTSGAEEEKTEKLKKIKKNNFDETLNLFEEMVSTLKQRQNEEVFLLNESYRKQISLLETSMDNIEKRLKAETTSLSEQFFETLNTIKLTHDAEIESYKQQLENLSSMHVNEIKVLKENHNHVVEEIKYEYKSIIENLKEARQHELTVLENSNIYTQKLNVSLETLQTNSKVLGEVQNQMQNHMGVLNITREEFLKAKEQEIQLMRSALEKARDAAETERAQLIGLVKTLETKLVEQTQNAREDRWALEQVTAILTARSLAFDREVEFTRFSLQRESQQLKTLKETLLAEQERVMLQLTEEKLQVSAERARLETYSKLNKNFDSQKAQSEIEAALQVAKEAIELTDREREHLYKQQGEIESMKRKLIEKERKLNLKCAELDEIIINANEKHKEGEKALAEAKFLESKCNIRLKDIQRQLISLTNREKKLSEEKIAVSQERLALQSNYYKKGNSGYCENVENSDNCVEQDVSTLFLNHDPDIVRLQSEIDNNTVDLNSII